MLNEPNRARLTTIKGMLTDFLEAAVGDHGHASEITRIYVSEIAQLLNQYEPKTPADDDKVSIVPEINLSFTRRSMTLDLLWQPKGHNQNKYATLQAAIHTQS
ncbi:hypothetical protein [Roseofilum sp. Belize Diploria]|uniref:hypothetical protein n=1 Tax=Roseofilum sp. Belize Diploria TaxID=2821501 RepID=UPI001B11A108|nr:hypothetical protein [Roseofilum sp. Belize Diploria]MBP0008072.1 hypothetical protein [Roseofilum sp. Belize Diploria]